MKQLLGVLGVVFLACGSETADPEVRKAAAEPAPTVVAAAAKPPAVGSTAPDFTLTDQSGKTVKLSDARGKNAILVFYRGHW